MIDRSQFIKFAGGAAIAVGSPATMAQRAAADVSTAPDHTIRIAKTAIELAPGRIVQTTT